MQSNIIKNFIRRKIFKIDEKGIHFFHFIRFSAFPAKSMAVFIQAIGEKSGDNFLFDLGFEAGKLAAVENIKGVKLEKVPINLRMNLLNNLLEVVGFGKFDFKIFNKEKNKGLVHYTNNPVIEEACKLYGNKSKSCIFYSSVFSAHAEVELGLKNVRLKETQCICKGSKFCEWSHNISEK